MPRLIGRAALCMGLVAALSAQNPAGPQASSSPPSGRHPAFASGVELVALHVTVTDGRQAYVENLTRDDFLVLDDGTSQEVVAFAQGAIPVDLAVLIDTSASVRAQFATVRQAAIQLLDSLGPADRGTVIGFNERLHVLAEWTGDRRELERAVATLRARGGTSLYTALYVALKELSARTPPGDAARRRAIVVLSDGEDTTSLVSFDDVLDLCRRAGVSLYTIRTARPNEQSLEMLTLRRNRRANLDYTMRTLAGETGARAFSIEGLAGLPGVYTDIRRELAHQYLVGYVPSAATRAGSYSRVTVSVPGRRDLTVRTRPGYVREQATRAAMAAGK